MKFWVKGNPGGETEVSVYNSAGGFMGTLKVALDAEGEGRAEYGLDGIAGRRPAPGGYFAVARGGGVSDKKIFFVVPKRP